MKRFANLLTLSIIPKRLMILFVCVSAWMCVNAEGVIVDGLKYFVYPDTHEAVIIDENTWTGELIIPSEFKYNNETYIVKTITTRAFINCHELTKVRLPKTLEKITAQMYGMYGPRGWVSPFCLNPFVGCTSLESIEVDEENSFFCSIDGVLFSKDKTQLYSYPAAKKQASYSVPESVSWIGDDVFFYNTSLTTVKMPNSVTFMGTASFAYCSNLESVKLSESLTFLSAFSFDKCENLRFLEIPESVVELGQSNFRWTALEKLVIRGRFPNGIRDDAFYNVSNSMVLYVQRSEIEKFKQVFSGTILPLDAYTGIDNTSVANASFASNLFDLQGRRLNGKPAKGMYIQGGKKYVK